MASDRIKRRIEDSVDQRDWPQVSQLGDDMPVLDPDNANALGFPGRNPTCARFCPFQIASQPPSKTKAKNPLAPVSIVLFPKQDTVQNRNAANSRSCSVICKAPPPFPNNWTPTCYETSYAATRKYALALLLDLKGTAPRYFATA